MSLLNEHIDELMQSPLDFDTLRMINVQRCETVFHPLNSWSIADWAVAVGGEAGEMLDAVKKLRRVTDGTNTTKDPQTEEKAIEEIKKELADVVIYADLLAARLGVNLGEAIRDKFNEVSDRYGSDLKL